MIRSVLRSPPARRGLTIGAFALLFLVQAAPAVQIAVDQSRLLATGRPVLLATATRDPRDLFRGEYSVLAYEAGQPAGLPAAENLARAEAGCGLAERQGCSPAAGATVYVTLAEGPDGLHRAAAISSAPPGGDAPFLRGTLRSGTLTRRRPAEGAQPACEHDLCFSGLVEYGIERWYGPQGKPAGLDRLDRGRIRIRARVAPDGTASLDALVVDGRDVARTPRL